MTVFFFSAILPREISAVNEWISSGQLFHVMRDHPEHKAVILAGKISVFIWKVVGLLGMSCIWWTNWFS